MAPDGVSSIALDRVALEFGTASDRLEVLDGIDLGIGRREIVALIGPNGCGKSSLLRVVGGLLRPSGGSVRIDGAPLDGPSSRVGFVFQEPRLLPWLTTAENVGFPLELAGWSTERRRARVDDLLGLVGLRDFAAVPPGHLSGGMRQRAAIARALALEPSILLLDEPFSALDALTRERFNLELLRLWERTGTTIVVVTHGIPEAVLLADRVVVLTPRPARVAGIVPVPLPRPRALEMLESSPLATAAAEIRRLLVDTTDDAVALREAAAFRSVPEMPAPPSVAVDGAGAWSDPFRTGGAR